MRFIRFAQRTDPQSLLVRTAISRLQAEGHQLLTSVQNCIEFWNVATRPVKSNGFGLIIPECAKSLTQIERIFMVVPNSATIFQTWQSLVVNDKVSGVKVHDAHLVAVMLGHKIERILTFNDVERAVRLVGTEVAGRQGLGASRIKVTGDLFYYRGNR